MFKQWNYITNNFYINVELISLIFVPINSKQRWEVTGVRHTSHSKH